MSGDADVRGKRASGLALSCHTLGRAGPEHESVRADQSLLAEGWERRFLADEARAAEARDTYQRLGYEVLLVPPRPADFANECAACGASACQSYVLVYTRRRPGDDHE